ncbi:MAG: response regulator [Chloroherpetonaceae bacterium]|nr:response regulator [Chloroherpetonaceae bacterium]
MQKHHLLLVDDEPMILHSLSLLFCEDYVVHTATSGTEGLELLQQHPISVIISDQRMPQMTGIEFLRQAKEIAPNAIRILMTGYSDLQAVIDSVNVGEVFRYINKPWQAEKLKETVRFACMVASQRSSIAKEKIKVPASGLSYGLSKPEQVKSEYELLFVDSNPSHLQSFKEFFEPKYVCHTTNSPNDALDMLRRFPIAVLVSEACLNDVNGADFLIAAKSVQPEVVTVLMTSMKDAKIAVRLINEGQVYRYLVKPFARESLRLTIESAVIHYKLNKENPHRNAMLLEQALYANQPRSETRSFQELLTALRQRLDTKPIY